MTALPRTDISGIVYIIENAQQFWSELDDILHIPDKLTLSRLDATLRQCISFCAAYHEQYLQSPLQLQHACDLLLASDLFTFHSERMTEILTDDVQTSTDPHVQYILYSVLLAYGRRAPSFLRSPKRWEPILPLLMDHVLLDIDPDVEDAFFGLVGGSGSVMGSGRGTGTGVVPIEAKLRSLSVRLLYEVCRVQKMPSQELRVFDDTFISHLFDLVEQTRGAYDETFNYSVIKLIVALNEQFMVACLPESSPSPSPVPGSNSQPGHKQDHHQPHSHHKAHIHSRLAQAQHENDNRILRTLMSRLSTSPTFGENLIFMLNRADRTDEDLCMQLLVLKLLYLLFTTKGTSEYFYTNDLCVLVDVFLREILNLDEDNESLRHTYLRVLHPLLTKTQMRDIPYKRPQITRVLESLVANERIRDVNLTTKRLVERCLSGEWCVQLRKAAAATGENGNGGARRQDSLSSDGTGLGGIVAGDGSQSASSVLMNPPLNRHGSVRGGLLGKMAKAHRSAESLNAPAFGSGSGAGSSAGAGANPRAGLAHRASPGKTHVEGVRYASNGSSVSSASLPRVAAAVASNSGAGSKTRRDRAGSVDVEAATNTFSSLSISPGVSLGAPHIRIYPTSPLSPPAHSPSSPLATPFPTGPTTATDTPMPDSPISISSSSSAHSLSTPSTSSNTKHRRAPPLPPPKRRKAPAIPGQASASLSPSASASTTPTGPLSSGGRQANSPYMSLAAASSQQYLTPISPFGSGSGLSGGTRKASHS